MFINIKIRLLKTSKKMITMKRSLVFDEKVLPAANKNLTQPTRRGQPGQISFPQVFNHVLNPSLKSKSYRSRQKTIELSAPDVQASDAWGPQRSSDELKFNQKLEKLELIFSNAKKHALYSFDKK
jgi:hypothetical protein